MAHITNFAFSAEFRLTHLFVLHTLLESGRTKSQVQVENATAVNTVVKHIYDNMGMPKPHQVDARAVYRAAWNLLLIDCGRKLWEDECLPSSRGTDPSPEYSAFFHEQEEKTTRAEKKKQVLDGFQLSR